MIRLGMKIKQAYFVLLSPFAIFAVELNQDETHNNKNK